MLSKRNQKYNQGDMIWLREDKENKCPRELAEVLGAESCPWGVSYIVGLVDVELEPGDDGLREICDKDIEGPFGLQN